MTTGATIGLAQRHGDAAQRARTYVGVLPPRPPAETEATLVDACPGPTREQLLDENDALRADNAWLRRQLEMRFEVLTLTVMGASAADHTAALDADCERWPTDPFGTPIDKRVIDAPVVEVTRG